MVVDGAAAVGGFFSRLLGSRMEVEAAGSAQEIPPEPPLESPPEPPPEPETGISDKEALLDALPAEEVIEMREEKVLKPKSMALESRLKAMRVNWWRVVVKWEGRPR
ncbi:MAG: hypothetical protein SWK76_13755 [Actinomycetota bacterium]|nr:hypothetical protein [Actinomycetota bacterium]